MYGGVLNFNWAIRKYIKHKNPNIYKTKLVDVIKENSEK